MSGILSSALNGSNSNLPDAAGRAFATSFSSQSGSSGAVLNQSGGSVQGLHNVQGGFNMSNMHGPYASRNSANLGGLPNGVQQSPGSGRYTINSLPNALSQLSLGSSHGHSGITNIGGPGVLPNMGNTGRITNAIGGHVGGSNTSRNPSSAGLANIPGLASRLNLTTPQIVSMSGNTYSSAGVPLSQNQYQAGNNHFSFMALLNESNAHDNATFDLNEFPQLSGRPASAGGSQGHLGLMQKHNIGFTQQNQEFSIQSEDFPALPGYKGGFNVGGNPEFTINAHQKEQLHENMANLMQSQQLSIGRSSGFNYGGTYSPHHSQQQHRSSSANGTGVSFLLSGNQDLHFHGPEQYQQFPQSQSRLINPFREKEMKSMQGSQSLPDQYGVHGLLSIIKMVNPAMTPLAPGIDLTTLGLNLNSQETLYNKFASPWSDEPARGEPEYSVPECYYAKQPPQLKQSYFARFRPETLFYIFYSMPKDEAQLFAATELYCRGWFYHKEHRIWFMRVKNMEPLVKTNTYERGCYICFDPNTWQKIRKDNFVLQYEMVEKRPALPQQ